MILHAILIATRTFFFHISYAALYKYNILTITAINIFRSSHDTRLSLQVKKLMS